MKSYRFGPGQFRLMLAFAVLVSHTFPFEVGRVAVMLFFVLSGFWVTAMYQERHGDLSVREVGSFFIGRALRIFPTYLIILGFTTLGRWVVAQHRLPHWQDYTLLGLSSSPHPIILPAWSLDIELQFYMTVPLICWLMGKSPKPWRGWLLIGAALAMAIASWSVGYAIRPWHLGYYFIAFAAGATAHFFHLKASLRTAMISLALFVLFGATLEAVPVLHPFIIKHSNYWIDRDIIALMWAALLVPFVAWNVRLPSGRWDRACGDLAFTLYLGQWFFVRHNKLVPFGGRKTRAVVMAMAAVVASLFIFLVIERPVEKIRRRILRILPHRQLAVRPQ